MLIKRLWGHLSRRRKYQFGMLLALMFICAFAEVISLGSVLPFLGVITLPERVYQYPMVAELAPLFGITTADQLLLPVTLIFVVTALLAGAVRLLQMWATQRFSYLAGHELSSAAFLYTLYQPYKTHLEHNSSEVISGVAKVEQLLSLLIQILTFLSSLVLAVFIFVVLFVVDPSVTISVSLSFGIIYGLIIWLTRRELQRNSNKIAQLQPFRVKAIMEGLGAIRDVLLGGQQQVYNGIYRRADLPWRISMGNNYFIADSPRYAIESLGIVLIAVMAFVLARQSGEAAAVIPILGVLALGAQRLLPALQQIFRAWSSMAGSRASIEDALQLLDLPLPKEAFASPSPLKFQKNVRFESVKFQYIHEGPLVLDGLDLTIPHGAKVGFVGSTGSGKTTILDLFMGLLVPTSGQIMVDGLSLHGDRLRAWQRIISHVPQSIFLTDNTFAENIAFGESIDDIDMDRVRQAARQANIAEFIESNPAGYNALVGERGIRLSGGQCQRIGIARALYGYAEVLVFDEATSALDNITEQKVMDSIKELDKDLTILIIAHRLSTISGCDMIVQLEHGKIVAQGTYKHLLEHSPSFLEMAKKSGLG